ncbi:hypothetical protein AMATHDRAFT_134475 [Amanita thiersii Skay4041]|uniref:TECPR1-like DysF domain-containing protein n=1 Tax=Amanita thiersii Skay4041 TaxID=703135 RepID=A0A2A9P1B2_9AGAR|nr:hypothetical protein AMATHDRAFT_134475 [Amanita thiersii Skay4041]
MPSSSPPPLPRRISAEQLHQPLPRLSKKSSIRRFFSTRFFHPRLKPPHHQDTQPSFIQDSTHVSSITLDSSGIDNSTADQDKFIWAVLYENQRGMTVFSVPYYSRLSLLPMDPAPYTLPNSSFNHSNPSFTSLDDYQLPDGTWHWVSKSWMIDMRSDSGEVQHDGFEYNWIFRKHNWRARVGSFNAGGWVRRRRWIRLMMRPGQPPYESDGLSPTGRTTPTESEPVTSGSTALFDMMPDDVWSGKDPEEDWKRCYSLMKKLEADSYKLELWYAWLEPHKDKGKGKRVEKDGLQTATYNNLGGATFTITSLPAKADIIAVLRQHVGELLHLFIYPDSRVRYIELLARVNLLRELDAEFGTRWTWNEVDFWSYVEQLSKDKM